MSRPMPLEELGLLCLLERVDASDPQVDRISRYGLLQSGLITEGESPSLTQEGAARLSELRQWRAELPEDLPAPGRRASRGR